MRLTVYFFTVLALTFSLVFKAQATQRDLFSEPVLSAEDRDLYAQIFEQQDEGNLRVADRLIARVTDPILMGHVQYQRYMHPTAYRSSYEDLHMWMISYADHPGAHTIYRLAQTRRVPGWKATPPARVSLYQGGRVERTYRALSVSRPKSQAGRAVWNRVFSLIRIGGPTAAEKTLKEKGDGTFLGVTRYDYMAWRIARSHFVNDNTEQAYHLAKTAANRSAARIPLADWIAGLAAWQMGLYEEALPHFERLMHSDTAPPWAKSGAAFWAARSALKFGTADEVWGYAEFAAKQPTSFYSLLARSFLGWPLVPGDDGLDLVSTPAMMAQWQSDRVRRARAASEVGRDDIASNEIRAAFSESPAGDRAALLALVPHMNVPSFAMQVGRSVDSAGVPGRLALQYPVPSWEPLGGFEVDRAVIFALIRQESRFKPRAKSGAGARGLMQLMPRTASYIANDPSLRQKRRYRLFDPAFNMALGQSYVQYLMRTKHVGTDLLHVAAAYNGGPGSLSKWKKSVLDQTDPLLFMETIPHRETRHFARTILTNVWLYRHLLDQPAPSLHALAQGDWPLYEPLDNRLDRDLNLASESVQ